jgi:hypothetical protein
LRSAGFAIAGIVAVRIETPRHEDAKGKPFIAENAENAEKRGER